MISYSRLGLDAGRYQRFRKEDEQQGKRGISIVGLLITLAFFVALAMVIK